MGTEIVWDNHEQTVVRFIYQQQWSWDDCHSCTQQGKLMMDLVSHPVVLIFDMCESAGLPPNPMRHFRLMVNRLRNHRHKNIFVFVGADDYVRAVCSAIHRIYLDVRVSAEFHFADTLDEARHIAQQLQQQLVAKSFSDTQPIY